MKRREFLKTTAAGIGVASLPVVVRSAHAVDETAPAATRYPGKLVVVKSTKALASRQLPSASVVEDMVGRAIMGLTGKPDVASAWGEFVHRNDRVGIKPNALGGRTISTNKEVVHAVIKGIIAAGVPVENIVVWEQYPWMMRAMRGYINVAPDIKVEGVITKREGWSKKIHRFAGKATQVCKVIERITAFINIPVLKDHDLFGVTVAMKNITHGTIIHPPTYHSRRSDQIARIYADPLYMKKHRVVIADWLRAQYEGGPQGKPQYRADVHTIAAATDMVAIDAYGYDLVERLRRESKFKLKPLKGSAREPKYIEAAAKLGLGVADLTKCKIDEINLG
ncbi:MAG: DUF362 domain-containing protein [Deltaproteobacteria bacterium]|nr:DUF362 domain-containing protein [Deltaproteobacteria bacterium]